MTCGECKYFGFVRLVRFCRHPDHPARLKKWPGRCPEFVDWERKTMPDDEPNWPMPIPVEQLLKRS